MITRTSNKFSHLFVLVFAVIALFTPLGVEAGKKQKWDRPQKQHKKHHGWWKPCSDGWWGAMRENKEVRAGDRRVLGCLVSNCKWELKMCANDMVCRQTTRCLRDCGDDGRECAFDCIKSNEAFNSEEVKALGQCAISNECMQSP